MKDFKIGKEHSKNLLRNILEITDKPTKKIIISQPDIKLRKFIEEELDIVLKKLKAEKLQALMKYSLKYGRQNLTKDFFDHAMLCINKT